MIIDIAYSSGCARYSLRFQGIHLGFSWSKSTRSSAVPPAPPDMPRGCQTVCRGGPPRSSAATVGSLEDTHLGRSPTGPLSSPRVPSVSCLAASSLVHRVASVPASPLFPGVPAPRANRSHIVLTTILPRRRTLPGAPLPRPRHPAFNCFDGTWTLCPCICSFSLSDTGTRLSRTPLRPAARVDRCAHEAANGPLWHGGCLGRAPRSLGPDIRACKHPSVWRRRPASLAYAAFTYSRWRARVRATSHVWLIAEPAFPPSSPSSSPPLPP